MKEFIIIVLHPGMSYFRRKIKATHFEVKDGIYYFYNVDTLVATFPVSLTIIDEIDYNIE